MLKVDDENERGKYEEDAEEGIPRTDLLFMDFFLSCDNANIPKCLRPQQN